MKTIEVNGQMFLASAITSMVWEEKSDENLPHFLIQCDGFQYPIFPSEEPDQLTPIKTSGPPAYWKGPAATDKTIQECRQLFEQAKKDWKDALRSPWERAFLRTKRLKDIMGEKAAAPVIA